MVDIGKRKEMAMNYFSDGYNCAQSVVLAYSDFTGLDSEALAAISSSLGAGMGRLREVCGAVSGMFLINGFMYRAADHNDREAKIANYKSVQLLASEFTKANGSIVCRELLGLTVKSEKPTPEARTAEYYKKRPCRELVGFAAELLGTAINEKIRASAL